MYISHKSSKVAWIPGSKTSIQIIEGQAFIDFGYLGADKIPTIAILGSNEKDPILIP